MLACMQDQIEQVHLGTERPVGPSLHLHLDLFIKGMGEKGIHGPIAWISRRKQRPVQLHIGPRSRVQASRHLIAVPSADLPAPLTQHRTHPRQLFRPHQQVLVRRYPQVRLGIHRPAHSALDQQRRTARCQKRLIQPGKSGESPDLGGHVPHRLLPHRAQHGVIRPGSTHGRTQCIRRHRQHFLLACQPPQPLPVRPVRQFQCCRPALQECPQAFQQLMFICLHTRPSFLYSSGITAPAPDPAP